MITPPFFRFPFRRPIVPYYTFQKEPVENIYNSNKILLNTGDWDNKKAEESKKNCDYTSQIFNIMGITFYFDDILIIFLLFFLYSEDVHDDLLFIVLIMLLLN